MTTTKKTATKLTAAQARDWAEARDFNTQADLREIELARAQRSLAISQVDEYSAGIIRFEGEVGPDSALAFQSTLGYHLRQGRKDVTIYINSPGGCIVSGLALIDDIEAAKAAGMKVTIVVRGEACSMAGVILQAASPGCRLVGRRSVVMIHNGGFGAAGATHEVVDRVEYMRQLLGTIAELFAEANTKGKEAKFFLDLFELRKDLYYKAPDAVALGIADAIG